MTGRQVAGILAVILLIAGLILILSFLGLLIPILAVLGIALFVLIIAAVLIIAILAIVLAPHYYLTKKSKVEPGSYRLEEVEEK